MTVIAQWSRAARPCRKPLPAKTYFEGGRMWKTIPLLELGNRYEVSFDGLVRSVRTKRPRRPIITARGYVKVRLDGREYFVHRLMGFAFLGCPEPDETHTNHIDGDRAGNRLSNIEWSTPSNNCLHAYRTGLHQRLLGSRNGAAKLTEDEVRQIRRSYPGSTQAALATRFGISQRMVSLIVRQEKWTHVR